MFERFGEQARTSIVEAQKAARGLAHKYIGTEHILLGLSATGGSVADYVLRSFDFSPETIRTELVRIVGKDDDPPEGQIPFTPRSKRVLEAGLREAIALKDTYIGTEHILLGLLQEDEGVASAIFKSLKVDTAQLRQATLDARSTPVGERERESALSEVASRRRDKRTSRTQVSDSPADQEGSEPTQGHASEPREAVEAVPTHSDRPAKNDELGRRRLAAVLGERIRRARNERTDVRVETIGQRRRKRADDVAAARRAGSFMVHIHAPWGAGKSSLLNFLGEDLRNRNGRKPANPSLSQWIVVEFSAWEHQRLIAPWWWLLAAIQRTCARELWQMDRGRWLWFWLRDVGWRVWNARAAMITVLILVGIVVAGWASDWFGLAGQSVDAVRTVVLTVAASLTLAGTVLGLARGISKWLAIGSAEGAIRFLRRAHDPLGVYRRRFRWLVKSAGRPIAIFIDDLDRCRPEYVVELLEGIQTLFTDEPVAYVVAADRSWVCESFAHTYVEFEQAVGEPGRPLGFLFLEKTFQVSVEIPPMSNADRSRYWDHLMRPSQPDPDQGTRDDRDLGGELADATTQAEVEEGVRRLVEEGADREEALQAGVRRLNAPDMEGQLERLLSEFAPLLENNPRSMKRLMNAYGIERDRLLREGHILSKTERRQLALLTILRLRWPLLADHLRDSPADTIFCDGTREVPGEHAYSTLLKNQELRSLFDGSNVSVRLDAAILAEFPPSE